jgi:hypothetical protein
MSLATDRDTESILQGLDHLGRVRVAAELRAEKASAHGAELASVVYRYIVEHPEAKERSVLAAAYSTFMAAHAGNFGPSIHPKENT